MARWLIVAAIAATTTTADLTDEPWQAAARQCAAQYSAEYQRLNHVPCLSCSAGWPEVAKCTVRSLDPTIAEQSVDWCIAQITKFDRGKPMAHDRVADVISCLSPSAHQ